LLLWNLFDTVLEAEGIGPIGARTVEAPGSHSVFLSRPAAVADLIKQE
jgi:hypothetical protein